MIAEDLKYWRKIKRKMIINCEDCNKEIDDNDVLVRQHHLCDNCIRKRMSDFMDRVRKSGKCSDCGKIITTNDDKEFWDVMGVCLDCFYSIKN